MIELGCESSGAVLRADERAQAVLYFSAKARGRRAVKILELFVVRVSWVSLSF